MHRKYMKGSFEKQLEEKLEDMFPGDKLAPYRPDPSLEPQEIAVTIALARLKARCIEDLVVASGSERWGEAMQHVRNLRQVFTLEWQMEQRNGKKRFK